MMRFPEGFLWGAATSAHQVEGGTVNDWSEWEKANAQRLARQALGKFRHLASWPDIGQQAQDPANYVSGDACDHYNRFREDFNLAKLLGHTAHRFSIEWSRVEPEEGVFDDRAIEHYRRVVAALRERGMEPFVTLWHWPLPLWLAGRGGWESPDAADRFVRYARKMALALPDVRYWLTINEPEIWTSHAYLQGVWPPQKKSFFTFLRVAKHLVAAHRSAYTAIKKANPDAQVGIAKHNIFFEAAGGPLWPWNRFLKYIADWWWNRSFLNRIRRHQDFIGLNHYLHNRISGWFNRNRNERISEFLGWELYPRGIYHALMELKPYGKPIYITENGLADAHDRQRVWYITETLKNVRRAIADGADVRGYLYWSLLDNFEWDKGFWPRFGLIAVDYKTMERTVRPSAQEYARMIGQNGI